MTSNIIAEQQSNMHKYAFFMAKWKYQIYKKAVKDLLAKEHLLRLEHEHVLN